MHLHRTASIFHANHANININCNYNCNRNYNHNHNIAACAAW